MKIIVYPIAMGIFLIVLLMGCGGDGGGGGEEGADNDVTSEAASIAEEIADDIIAKEYPQFASVIPEYQGYKSQGRYFHSFTYMRMIEYESNGSVIRIPHNVVVNVDEDTGETEIFLSN